MSVLLFFTMIKLLFKPNIEHYKNIIFEILIRVHTQYSKLYILPMNISINILLEKGNTGLASCRPSLLWLFGKPKYNLYLNDSLLSFTNLQEADLSGCISHEYSHVVQYSYMKSEKILFGLQFGIFYILDRYLKRLPKVLNHQGWLKAFETFTDLMTVHVGNGFLLYEFKKLRQKFVADKLIIDSWNDKYLTEYETLHAEHSHSGLQRLLRKYTVPLKNYGFYKKISKILIEANEVSL